MDIKLGVKRKEEEARKKKTLETLDARIKEASESLVSATDKLKDMDPTDKMTIETNQKGNKVITIYDQQVKDVEILTKNLALLIDKQEAVTNPKKDFNDLPWYKKLNINDFLKIAIVSGISLVEVWGMIRLQQEGHLVGREWERVRLPRA